VGETEKAIRAELDRVRVTVGSSVLAAVAVNLARRLDSGPGDRAASMLSRELRLVMAELWRQAKGETDHDLERFLGSISTPAFRGPGD
jgi:uncharacterized protein (DUF2267 family)